MQLPRKRVLAGALLGLIPVALGIVALTTPKWFYDTKTLPRKDSLFNVQVNNQTVSLCYAPLKQQVVEGLEIGGVAAIGVGIIVSVLLHTVTRNRWIRLLPLILLILGPTAIMIGLILLLECAQKWGLGYSFILMIAAGLSGYVLAAYFAFVSAFGEHHHHRTSSTLIVRESVRF